MWKWDLLDETYYKMQITHDWAKASYGIHSIYIRILQIWKAHLLLKITRFQQKSKAQPSYLIQTINYRTKQINLNLMRWEKLDMGFVREVNNPQ